MESREELSAILEEAVQAVRSLTRISESVLNANLRAKLLTQCEFAAKKLSRVDEALATIATASSTAHEKAADFVVDRQRLPASELMEVASQGGGRD